MDKKTIIAVILTALLIIVAVSCYFQLWPIYNLYLIIQGINWQSASDSITNAFNTNFLGSTASVASLAGGSIGIAGWLNSWRNSKKQMTAFNEQINTMKSEFSDRYVTLKSQYETDAAKKIADIQAKANLQIEAANTAKNQLTQQFETADRTITQNTGQIIELQSMLKAEQEKNTREIAETIVALQKQEATK